MITTTLKQIHKKDISTRRIVTLCALSLLGFGSIQPIANAGANLMITPTRVVFDERERSKQVTIMNTGNETGNFRISYIRQDMTETGQFEPVEEGEKGMFSDRMVRYSPRQVTLPPGQSQVIRLMLRKPRDLQDGEYRSHMLFQALPKPSKNSIDSVIETNQKGITVEIIPIVGISIPVIVEQGKLSSTVSLSDIRYTPASEAVPKASIGIDIHRTGNGSAYGDFRATFTPHVENPDPEAKLELDSIVVGQTNGVAVYANSSMRHLEIPINAPAEVELANGELRIVFLESGKDENTGLIAEIKLDI